MSGLDQAIADAREALARVEHERRGTDDDAYFVACAKAAEKLDDLLAALDAARGEAVAYALPKALAETRADGFTVVRAGHQHHADGTYCVPLYAAPPAAPRVERYGDGVLVHWPEGVEQYIGVGDCVTGNLAVPPAALADERTPIDELVRRYEFEGCDFSDAEWVRKASLRYVQTMPDSQVRCLLYRLAQQPAAAVPAANVTPMRQPRADLARLVESINAAVYANGDGLSVTEAIGALELAKLELLKEQEQ